VIHLAEIDLAAPTAVVPVTSGRTRLLVRWGAEVLGEVEVPVIDAYWSHRIHDEELLRYAPRILALEREAGPSERAVDVTVVVCTRDRADLLVGALDAIDALRPRPASVIVVDNAPSTDAAALVCNGRPVRRIVEPEPGLDRARNRGWRAASTEVVAYVDDDARPDRTWIRGLRMGFAHADVGAVTGLVLAAELDTYAQTYFERRLGGMAKGFERRCFGPGADPGFETFRIGVGTNMAYRRDVLEELGGFDPRFDVGTATRGAGDLEMFARVLASQRTIVYEPSALVRHLHRVDRSGLLDQLRDNGTSFRAFLEHCSEASPGQARAVRRYLRRWHLRRHVLEPIRAARRRDLLGVQAALAEARGSRRGRSAWATEAHRVENRLEATPLEDPVRAVP
jgi:glycosyltransferase involved in cell wall biosynthesis